MEPLRTRIYIDGYNLYYGCLKGTSHKWLDLIKLFEQRVLPSIFSPQHPLRLLSEPSIKFFTAKIIERVATATDSVSSQARYHTALRKVYPTRVQLVEGYYAVNEMKVKIIDADKPKRPPRECTEALAWKIEEKQSDVSLALHAYHDAITGAVDQVVFVTNDTDLAPALQMVREFTDAQVGLVIPTCDQQRIPNTDLAQHAHWVRTHITQDELADCQFPRVIAGRKATLKPESWYANPEMLRRVLELAIPIRGSRADAFKWLETPNAYFRNQRPIELLDTETEALEVIAYIHAYIAQKN